MPSRLRSIALASLAALAAIACLAPQLGARAEAAPRVLKLAASGKGVRASLSSSIVVKRSRDCSPRAVRSHQRVARMSRAQRRRAPQRLLALAAGARLCKPNIAVSSASSGPLYWGAWIGDHLTGDQAPWDMSATAAFEQRAGKALSLIHFSSPFANCSGGRCTPYGFPAGPMEKVREHGAIPFFSWGSQATPASLDQPDFQLADVIEGRHDAYIRRFAEEARDWGHPFFLRFNWEMNGRWFAWAEGVNGNVGGEYVAAWRHVHDIFAAVGATNATWVWCPNVDPDGEMADLAPLYPGDSYVDWTGLDGYNWGTHPVRNDRWRSFDQLFRSTYQRIVTEIAPGKPMVVAEMGSTEHGGSKAAWIADALAAVPSRYPAIRALMWFEKYDDGMDWPIATSAGATAAFAAGIQQPAYLGNAFGQAPAGPIQPIG